MVPRNKMVPVSRLPDRPVRVWVLGMLLAGIGCNRDAPTHDAAPATTPSRPNAPPAAAHRGVMEAWTVVQLRVSFLMRGKLETSRGSLSVGRGDLQVDVSDLTRTRGAISIDLTSLTMSTFKDASENEKQTTDALTWLEVQERGTQADVRERNRWATFTIARIESAEPRDLTSIEGAQRRARISARGDLSLHGGTTSHRVELEAAVAFDRSVPKTMHMRTIQDLRLNLEEHQIQPRDAKGKLLARLSQPLQDKLADSADVAVSVAAKPSRD